MANTAAQKSSPWACAMDSDNTKIQKRVLSIGVMSAKISRLNWALDPMDTTKSIKPAKRETLAGLISLGRMKLIANSISSHEKRVTFMMLKRQGMIRQITM